MRKQKSIITVKQLLYIFLDSGVKLRATYPRMPRILYFCIKITAVDQFFFFTFYFFEA